MMKECISGECSIVHNSFGADEPYPVGIVCPECNTFFCLSCVLNYWPMDTRCCQECEYQLSLRSTSDWDSFMAIVGSKKEAEWRNMNSHLKRRANRESVETASETLAPEAYQDTPTPSSSSEESKPTTKSKKGAKKVANKTLNVSIWDTQEDTGIAADYSSDILWGKKS